jgi:hypothetical protein
MGKFNMARFFKNTQKSIVDHGPEILTVIGIAGMATTTVLAVKATPKALELIEKKKKEDSVETLPPKDVVKTTWKCYLPAAIAGVTSTACLIGACSVSARRYSTLAAAYKISETALIEYQNKVVETIGENKEKAVRQKVNKEKLEKNPIGKSEVIVTKKGNTRCMDGFSKRYFLSDLDEIERAINRLNGALVRDGEVCLNDFYDELGIAHSEVGDKLGWNVNRVGRDLIELEKDAQLDTDNEPCIVINCYPRPEWDYDRY